MLQLSRTCVRPAPGYEHSENTVTSISNIKDVLLLIAKMSEDSVNNFLVLDAGDDLHSTPAPSADRDVYIESAFRALSPGHSQNTRYARGADSRSVTLGR